MKSWDELTICDDYMCKLITSCKQMLERILHIEIADLLYIETEKSMTTRYHVQVSKRTPFNFFFLVTIYDVPIFVHQFIIHTHT